MVEGLPFQSMSPPAVNMDEQKPLVSSDSGGQGSVEARFADFCKVVTFPLIFRFRLRLIADLGPFWSLFGVFVLIFRYIGVK